MTFHIWATLFDPSNDGFDIQDLSILVGILVAIGGIIVAAARGFASAVRRIVREELAEATRPIQPKANGGLSLPDVARTAQWNAEAIEALGAALGVALPPKPQTNHD